MSLYPELKRHSASQLNSFIEYRADWYLQRIKGIKTGVGPAAYRGTAVEAGINYFIENEDVSIEDCVKHAFSVYAKESIGSPDNFDIRQSVGPATVEGIKSFESKGYFIDPPTLQDEIECLLPGCRVKLYGKLDYNFPKEIIDNKVVSKTPSSLKQGYVLQGAIYRFATGKNVKFHFVIPQKKGVSIKEIQLSDKEYEYGINLASRAAVAIERIFDNLGTLDGDLLESLFFTNPSSLFDVRAKALHSEQFGVKIPMENISEGE